MNYTLVAGLMLFAAGSAFSQEANAPAAAADAKIRVNIYRYKAFQGKAVRPSIYVDEKDVAQLQSGRGVILALAPGKHTFRSNDKQSVIELDLKSGPAYYIRIDIAVGFLKGHGRLTLVAPEQGAAEYRQSKPADKGVIKDKTFIAPEFTPED